MRARRLVLAALMLGCGEISATADAGGPRDAGTAHDGAVGQDAALANDAALGTDARVVDDGGLGADSGRLPEACAGGIDDDGDGLVDCDDDACWEEPECASEHVARALRRLTPCGAAVERTASESRDDCVRIGTPVLSTTPTECQSELEVESTIRFFCDGSTVAAAWVLERLRLPGRRQMTSPRTYETQRYEYEPLGDWERVTLGGTDSSGAPTPVRSIAGPGSASIVTVRAVDPGATVERLVGLARVTSVIDLDAPMTTSTREGLRTGATRFSVPR